MHSTPIESLVFPYATIDAPTRDSIYQLRFRTFHQRLGWQVQSAQGREYDHFDRDNTVYSVLKVHDRVLACTRLIQTTNDYMFGDLFPQLARGEPLPHAPHIWEISRFTVDRSLDRAYYGVISNATYEIFRSLYRFACERKISEYVMVTTTAGERIMKLMGLKVERFGDHKVTRLGRVDSVALHLPVNMEFARSVYH